MALQKAFLLVMLSVLAKHLRAACQGRSFAEYRSG